MSDATARRVEGVGFAIAMAGLLVSWFCGSVGATHHSSVTDLVVAGPLALPALGVVGSVVLLAATRRRRGRVFAALWAAGSAASVLIVRMRADVHVAGLDEFLIGTTAVALGACLCLVPPKGAARPATGSEVT